MHLKFFYSALLIGALIGRSNVSAMAETISVDLPGLVGRYYDTHWNNPDVNLFPYGEIVPVDVLNLFEHIDEVRLRIRGEMQPSKWMGPNYDTGEMDEWSELSGLEFFIYTDADASRAIVAGKGIERGHFNANVEFDEELAFRPFFIPNLNVAREFDNLDFTVSPRFVLFDLSPKPAQIEMGVVDIWDAQLLVTGALLGTEVPEQATFLLAGWWYFALFYWRQRSQ